jgi:hypothetical protein
MRFGLAFSQRRAHPPSVAFCRLKPQKIALDRSAKGHAPAALRFRKGKEAILPKRKRALLPGRRTAWTGSPQPPADELWLAIPGNHFYIKKIMISDSSAPDLGGPVARIPGLSGPAWLCQALAGQAVRGLLFFPSVTHAGPQE